MKHCEGGKICLQMMNQFLTIIHEHLALVTLFVNLLNPANQNSFLFLQIQISTLFIAHLPSLYPLSRFPFFYCQHRLVLDKSSFFFWLVNLERVSNLTKWTYQFFLSLIYEEEGINEKSCFDFFIFFHHLSGKQRAFGSKNFFEWDVKEY